MWMWRHEPWKNLSPLTSADWAANYLLASRRGMSSFFAFPVTDNADLGDISTKRHLSPHAPRIMTVIAYHLEQPLTP